MSHSLGGVVVHVDEGGDIDGVDSLYALQQVLDATVETISYFGAQSQRRQLQFVLDEDENGNSGKSTLLAAAIANSDVNLTLDIGSQGNYRILTIRFDRKMAANHTNPVYKTNAELIKV